MTEKEVLQQRAAELGINFEDSDTMASLREWIAEAEVKEEDQSRVSVADLEAHSEALFGVPRSVFVGAKSAGFISGERLTKEEASEGVRKFLTYQGSR